MGFGLRGGRPKNTGQGVYWVQRNQAATRTRTSAEARTLHFNDRYGRITGQFLGIFQPYAGPTGTIKVVTGSPLDQALDRYNDIKSWIDSNIDQATNAHLSKLATAAKRILTAVAKREGWISDWDSETKVLTINDRKIDFS